MSLVTQEKEIAGHRWAVTQLPAMAAMKLSAKLVKLLGPALATIGPEGLKADAGPAISAFLSGLDPEELERMIRQVFEQATRDGKPVMVGFDATFQGRVDEVYLALAWALQVNFPFVKRLLDAAGAFLQKASPSN